MKKRRKKKLNISARIAQLKKMESCFRPGTGLHKSLKKARMKMESIEAYREYEFNRRGGPKP